MFSVTFPNVWQFFGGEVEGDAAGGVTPPDQPTSYLIVGEDDEFLIIGDDDEYLTLA